MLRAPTWRMSACSATSGTSAGSMTSVMTARPVRSRASTRYPRPSAPRPWKEYGLVRGLNAPPRSTVAPAARTASAVSSSWSRLSTEQGPAMMVRPPSPIDRPRTRTTVSSGWNSREASLKGLLMGVTVSTPGSDDRWFITWSLRPPTSPTTPMTTRSMPRLSWGVRPTDRMWSSTAVDLLSPSLRRTSRRA